MKQVFLLGFPVAHSLSPLLHNAAFEELGIDYRYELLATPPGRLAEALDRVRSADCAGANVTAPHKQAVIPLLDDLGESARKVGAVNTLVKRKGRLVGENTDVPGLLYALDEARVHLQDKRVVLLGAGGAARAAAFAFAGQGVKSITVVNRTATRAHALVAWLHDWAPQLDLRAGTPEDVATADLVVNATSAGMAPDVYTTPLPPDCRVPSHAVAYDLIYSPTETRFLREAREEGARAIGGMGMLAYQGRAAFRLWTGADAPEVWSRYAALAYGG